MDRSSEQVLNVNKMDPLNLLRTVAMLCVFLLHTTLFEPEIQNLFAQGSASFMWRTPAWGGVWIFLIISGYLGGKGYASGRYQLGAKGVWSYYRRRFLKVIVPTFSFIFLVLVLSFPEFVVENPEVIIRFFTFTYRAEPGVNGISATWYVFTLFWLYLITPLAGYVLNKLRERERILWMLLTVLAVVALCWRW